MERIKIEEVYEEVLANGKALAIIHDLMLCDIVLTRVCRHLDVLSRCSVVFDAEVGQKVREAGLAACDAVNMFREQIQSAKDSLTL